MTPQEIKDLASAVEAIREETKNEIKSHDAVTQGNIKRLEDAIKPLLDAKNAPQMPSEDDIKAEAEELTVKFLRDGEKALVKNGSGFSLKTDPTVTSLTVGAEGGYVLPTIFAGLTDQYIRNATAIRQVARVVNAGMHYVQPIKVSGATGATRTEKGPVAPTNAPQYDSITFKPFDVYAEVAASAWALEGDAAIDIIGNLIADAAAAVGEKEGHEFLLGTATNTLANSTDTINNGLLSQAKLVAGVDHKTAVTGSLAGVETAGVGAITFSDLAAVRSTLPSAFGANASWMFSKDVELKLLTLEDSMGRYVWSLGDVKSGGKATIWGDSYITSDYFPLVASAGSVAAAVYGDFSKFVIADASQVQWTVDPYTNKGFVNYFLRRRTASSITNFGAFRGLYIKAA